MRRVTGTHGTDTRCPHHCEKIQKCHSKGNFRFPSDFVFKACTSISEKTAPASAATRAKFSPRVKIVTSNQQYFISQTQSRRAE